MTTLVTRAEFDALVSIVEDAACLAFTGMTDGEIVGSITDRIAGARPSENAPHAAVTRDQIILFLADYHAITVKDVHERDIRAATRSFRLIDISVRS